MNRNQKRAELRSIDKESKWIYKHSPLSKIMKSKPFNALTADDIEVLERGEYPDKELQEQYVLVTQIMLKLKELHDRSVALRSKEV